MYYYSIVVINIVIGINIIINISNILYYLYDNILVYIKISFILINLLSFNIYIFVLIIIIILIYKTKLLNYTTLANDSFLHISR